MGLFGNHAQERCVDDLAACYVLYISCTYAVCAVCILKMYIFIVLLGFFLARVYWSLHNDQK